MTEGYAARPGGDLPLFHALLILNQLRRLPAHFVQDLDYVRLTLDLSDREFEEALAQAGATVRLCKGAYLEPPLVAFPEKADVDKSYVQIMTNYLEAPPPAVLQMATHDERIIAQAEELIAQHNIQPDRYEFQMLYGIRSARQESLAAAGHPVRVYVPFGSAWYPYFMRRLAERPANLMFFLKGATARS